MKQQQQQQQLLQQQQQQSSDSNSTSTAATVFPSTSTAAGQGLIPETPDLALAPMQPRSLLVFSPYAMSWAVTVLCSPAEYARMLDDDSGITTTISSSSSSSNNNNNNNNSNNIVNGDDTSPSNHHSSSGGEGVKSISVEHTNGSTHTTSTPASETGLGPGLSASGPGLGPEPGAEKNSAPKTSPNPSADVAVCNPSSVLDTAVHMSLTSAERSERGSSPYQTSTTLTLAFLEGRCSTTERICIILRLYIPAPLSDLPLTS